MAFSLNLKTIALKTAKAVKKQALRARDSWRLHKRISAEGLSEFVPLALAMGEKRRFWKRAFGLAVQSNVADSAIALASGAALRKGIFADLGELIAALSLRRGASVALKGLTVWAATLIPEAASVGVIAVFNYRERVKIKNAIRASVANPKLAERLKPYYEAYPPIWRQVEAVSRIEAEKAWQMLPASLKERIRSKEKFKNAIANASYAILAIEKRQELEAIKRELKQVKPLVIASGLGEKEAREELNGAKPVYKQKKAGAFAKNPFTGWL